MTSRFIALFAFIALTSCTVIEKQEITGHYWQRASSDSALYLRGPQAQHQLNKHIAECVYELKELERLGSIRDAVPADLEAERSDQANAGSKTAFYDTPIEDDINFTRYFDYADFDGCMFAKGWERVEYVPYNVADTSRDVYYKTIIDQENRKGSTPRRMDYDGYDLDDEDDFDNLNQ